MQDHNNLATAINSTDALAAFIKANLSTERVVPYTEVYAYVERWVWANLDISMADAMKWAMNVVMGTTATRGLGLALFSELIFDHLRMVGIRYDPVAHTFTLAHEDDPVTKYGYIYPHGVVINGEMLSFHTGKDWRTYTEVVEFAFRR